MQHHLFPAGRVSLRARVEDVVEQRAAADRARVRLVRHAGEIEPVVAVRSHHLGIPVIHFGEELPRSRRETADARLQRGPIQGFTVRMFRSRRNAMYSSTAAGKRRACSSALAMGASGGRSRLRCSASARNESRSRQLALHQRTSSCQVYGSELHVFQVPVVVHDADARPTRLRWDLRREPRREAVRGGFRAPARRRAMVRVRAAKPGLEIGERRRSAPERRRRSASTSRGRCP